MPRILSAMLIALTPFLHACGDEAGSSDDGMPAASADASTAIDFQRVASVLLARLDLQPDERVLLVALPGRFDPLMPLLRAGVDLCECHQRPFTERFRIHGGHRSSDPGRECELIRGRAGEQTCPDGRRCR